MTPPGRVVNVGMRGQLLGDYVLVKEDVGEMRRLDLPGSERRMRDHLTLISLILYIQQVLVTNL